MTQRFSLCLLATLLLVPPSIVSGQQSKKVPRIGFLATGSASDSQNTLRRDAFRQGLADLGYVEGKNILIEYRYAEGRSEGLPVLAEELARLKVDILVAGSAIVARAAKKSNVTIPIVVANIGNLTGLVASLARPGGNVTGLAHSSRELIGKRLELLKEVVPTVFRFAFLSNSVGAFKDAEGAAKALAVQFQFVEVKTPNLDLQGAFRVLAKERIAALVTEATPLMNFHRRRILELVEQNRIPAMHSEQEWPNDGGLMSYGANRVDSYRRTAVYVDKILKAQSLLNSPWSDRPSSSFSSI